MKCLSSFFSTKHRIIKTYVFLWTLFFCMTKVKAQSSSEIYKQLKKLNFLGSVLYLAAHPDDENTRVISYFSNHVLARTAYLSMTRGDGGQNLIGAELREALGLIRTQELLAARKIDGGLQFFTMANDFGYSKNPKETLSIWDKEQVLAQTIARIQKFKPDIIINRFNSGSYGKTHGHHTASAMISEWAFEKLHSDKMAWHPQRLFHNTSWYFYGSKENFEKANKKDILALDMGVYDPLSGKTNSEIAALSRSQHKSQGFGSAAAMGQRMEYLELVKGEKITQNDPFEGINTQWTRVKGGAPIGKAIEKIIDDFDFSAPFKSVTSLLEVKTMIMQLDDSHWKKIKTQEIKSLILQCLGIELQLNAQIPYGVLGENLQISFLVNNPSPLSVNLNSIQWKNKSFDLNENSKRFVSLLELKSENGKRGIWGFDKEKNKIWEKMYESEPRGKFIQFYRASTNPDLNERIKNLEEVKEAWGEPNNAPVINFLGYLYYRNGDKEKSEESFKRYMELYPDGYNSLDSMAEFFMFEKNYEEAKKYYEMVLNVFPYSTSARSSLNKIKEMK